LKRISIIGSGNVATHLAKAFFAGGCTVVEIYSRHPARAQALAATVQAHAAGDLQHLLPADLYIISVTDSAIPPVAAGLIPAGDALVVHTSGSTGMEVLHKFTHHGVLYPLQTFSFSKPAPDWQSIPVLIEAESEQSLRALKSWGSRLSPRVLEADSATRLQLHTAAVFGCNFVNYLLSVCAELSGEQFALFYPLVRETLEKAFAAKHPRHVQTGPAVRNDLETIKKQLTILSPEQQKLYLELSALIQKSAKNE
jgi:predicted short-subunit dehydrogenase-like oxidoreductase (DUF2520 family)